MEIEALESSAREACDAGDHRRAATLVLEGYGNEIHAFLLARLRGDEGTVDEIFSDFAEDFWRGLPAFEWRCSVRGWCYRLARNAAHRFRRSPQNRGDRRVPLSENPFVEQLVHGVRTRTQPYLRSEVKDAFQKLREQLSPEDQDLLILRVNRKLAWRDVAHALLAEDEAADEVRVRRLEVALRQRLTEVKQRLRELAIEAGLL
jgi:RNA polymerase sigma-70 factor, ECF subfamily